MSPPPPSSSLQQQQQQPQPPCCPTTDLKLHQVLSFGTDTIITQTDLNHLFSFFASHQPSTASRHSSEVQSIHSKVHALFSQDYDTALISNDWCATYPNTLILPLKEKHAPCPVNTSPSLIPLFRNSRFSRVRSRFVVPVLIFNGRNVCRSATLSNEAEVHINSFTELTKQFTRTMFNYTHHVDPVSPTTSSSSDEESSGTLNSSRTTIDKQRCADIALLRALNVTEIFDLMVENRKVKFGLTVTSSEKTDKRNRYSDFHVIPIPYPGVEFFADYKARHNCGRGLHFDWSQAFADAELNVTRSTVIQSCCYKRKQSLPDSSRIAKSPSNPLLLPKLSTSMIRSSIPSLDSSTPNLAHLPMLCDPDLWQEWRSWDVIQMTQHYLQLMLYSLVIPHHTPDAPSSTPFPGINVHCISGWDRTPAFISLIRLSLWADGLVHQSLSAEQVLYLTVAYDWMLFSHLLPDRMSRGEDIFSFCFYMLLYILDDKEFGLAHHMASPTTSCHLTKPGCMKPSSPEQVEMSLSPSKMNGSTTTASPGLDQTRLVAMSSAIQLKPSVDIRPSRLLNSMENELFSASSSSLASVPCHLDSVLNPTLSMDVPSATTTSTSAIYAPVVTPFAAPHNNNNNKTSTSWQIVAGSFFNTNRQHPFLETSKCLSPPITPTISHEPTLIEPTSQPYLGAQAVVRNDSDSWIGSSDFIPMIGMHAQPTAPINPDTITAATRPLFDHGRGRDEFDNKSIENGHDRRQTPFSSTVSNSWDPALHIIQPYGGASNLHLTTTKDQTTRNYYSSDPKPSSRIELVPISGCECCQVPGVSSSTDDDDMFFMDGSLLIVAPESSSSSSNEPSFTADPEKFTSCSQQPPHRPFTTIIPPNSATTSTDESEIHAELHASITTTSSNTQESCVLRSNRAQRLLHVRNLFAVAYRHIHQHQPTSNSSSATDWPPLTYARSAIHPSSPSSIDESCPSPIHLGGGNSSSSQQMVVQPGWSFASMMANLTTGVPNSNILPLQPTTNLSTPPPPVTFHIGPPQESSCLALPSSRMNLPEYHKQNNEIVQHYTNPHHLVPLVQPAQFQPPCSTSNYLPPPHCMYSSVLDTAIQASKPIPVASSTSTTSANSLAGSWESFRKY